MDLWTNRNLEGALRLNFILDIQTDNNWEGVLRPKKVGNFLVCEGCFKFGGAPGRVKEGDGVLVRLG